jgi:hypothetical protein
MQSIKGMSRVDAICFAGVAATVVFVSILAYAHLVPNWVSARNIDKILHFTMGGVLAFFLDRTLRQRRAWGGRWAPPLSSVLVLVPVGIDEYLQRFSSARSSSWGDFAADVAGIVVCTVLSRRLLQNRRSC